MLGRGMRGVSRSKIQSSRTRSSTASSGTFSTSFPSTETPVSQGGVWRSQDTLLSRVNTTPGKAFGTQDFDLGYMDSYAFVDDRAFNNNQYGEAVLYLEGGFAPSYNMEVEIILRCSDTSTTRQWYEILHNKDGGFEILYLNGPADGFTPLSTPTNISTPIVNGQVFRGEIVGNVISGYIDGVLKVQATDSTITSGKPGMAFFSRGGAVDAPKFCFSSYSCGNL